MLQSPSKLQAKGIAGKKKRQNNLRTTKRTISKAHYPPSCLILVCMGIVLSFIMTHYKSLPTVINVMLEVVNLNSNNSLNYCKENVAV